MGTPAYIAPEVLSRREYDGKVSGKNLVFVCGMHVDDVLLSIYSKAHKYSSSYHSYVIFNYIPLWLAFSLVLDVACKCCLVEFSDYLGLFILKIL